MINMFHKTKENMKINKKMGEIQQCMVCVLYRKRVNRGGLKLLSFERSFARDHA